MIVLKVILVSVIAYLLGSVSTGLVISKLFNGPNLREVGSKNTGTSNVLRTMGLKSGVLTFLGDFGKALLATLLGRLIMGQDGALLAGIVAIIGHNWPAFFQFKGGKGVASSIGVMMGTFPLFGLISLAVMILVIVWKRYISLGSIVLVLLFALLLTFAQGSTPLTILWGWSIAVVCIIRHRSNIERLRAGTESKVSLGSKK